MNDTGTFVCLWEGGICNHVQCNGKMYAKGPNLPQVAQYILLILAGNFHIYTMQQEPGKWERRKEILTCEQPAGSELSDLIHRQADYL